MIEVVVAGTIYMASLLGCYDGDTCKIEVKEFVPFQVYSLRLEGFDTPEIRGKCDNETSLAKEAQAYTTTFMSTVSTIYVSEKKDKYGRLIANVPKLGAKLIEQGLARPYDGGTRLSWCK
jgi:micrococcal nuclease